MSLNDLQQYIKVNNHLPDMPSAKEIGKNKTVDLGEMNNKLLQKIEELTLYIIQQQEEIEQLKGKAKNFKE